jgi:predicted pyridoxine 5'-phosphate oxidase superfamily flavin-nucleotide-binding protein
MANNFTELTFTEEVKNEQEKFGSRQAYERMESRGAFRNQITFQEELFIAARDGFYMSSIGKDDWPYVQFRGGPTGFLKLIGDNLFGYADFKGNGQYISSGNLKNNDKTMLFFMDYPNKKRLKLWARAEVFYADENPELLEKVLMPDYKAKVERIITYKVEAFDWNCPQHITPRYTEDEFNELLS